MVEMTTISLYAFLIAFIVTFHCVKGDSFYLISADDLCPNATLDQSDEASSEGSALDMLECLSLQEFVANRSGNLSLFGDDVVLEFGPGNHTIESASLFISNMTSFAMIATSSNSGSLNDVTISCQGARANITLESVETVVIDGINFKNCLVTTFESVDTLTLDSAGVTNGSFRLLDVRNATFIRSIFSNADPAFGCCNSDVRHGAVYILRTSLLVQSCIFRDNNGFESGGILSIDSILTVEQSIFHNNTGDGGFRRYNRRPGQSGGAIAMRETVDSINTTLSIAHSNFSANRVIGSAGGAIYVILCDSIQILGSNFFNNNARLAGGAVYIDRTAMLCINQSVFMNNTAQFEGGAVMVVDSIPLSDKYMYGLFVIEQSIFDNNIGDAGGAVYFNVDGRNYVNVNSCQFRNNWGWREGQNSDYHPGGAVYFLIQANTNSSVRVDQSTFISNRGTYGAAMRIRMGSDNTSAAVTRTDFSMNYGDSALYMSAQNIQISHCTLIGNLDGGVYVSGRFISMFQSEFFNNSGSVLRMQYETNGANLNITECTFMYNFAPQCEVLWVHGTPQTLISNSIFSYNQATRENAYGGAVCMQTSSSVSVQNSTFHHNSATTIGGVFAIIGSRCELKVSDSVFANNSVGGDGGVLSSDSLDVIIEFTRCSFFNNDAGNKGGVLSVGREGYAKFTECSFSLSNATRGGVAYADSSTIEIDSSVTFENNTASLGGTFIYACESIVALPNDLLFDIYLDDSHCILYEEKGVSYDNNSTARTRVQSFNVHIAASSNDCPITTSDEEPCLTLQQYIQSSEVYDEAYNLTIEFQPGQYSLLHNELTFVNKIFLDLRGTNVTIQCSGSVALVRMNTIQSVHVSGINIVDCEFYVNFVGNFLLEQSTFSLNSILYIQKTANSTIQHSSFSNRPCCQLTNGHPQRIIDIYKSGSILIQHCTFVNNRDGSIYGSRFSAVIIDDCNFSKNRKGAVITQDGDLIVTNCNFTNNIADSGGAVYATGANSRVLISRSEFVSNRSPSAAGSGGAVYFSTIHSASISRCNFIGNRAYEAGSRYPLSGGGGAIYASDAAALMIYRCKFRNNVARVQAGGAVYVNIQDSLYIGRSTFTDNSAYTSGGAVYMWTDSVCSVTVDHSRFFRNNITRVYEYHIFPQHYTDNGSALYIVAAAGSSVVINESNFRNNAEGRFPNVVQPVYIEGATDVRFETDTPTTLPAEGTTTLEIQTEITTALNTPPITHSAGLPTETTTSHPTTTSEFFTELATTIPDHSEPMETTSTDSSEFATTLGPTIEANTSTEAAGLTSTVSTFDATTYSGHSTNLATDKGTTDFQTETESITDSSPSSNTSQSTADQGTNVLVIALPTAFGIVLIAVICVAAVLFTIHKCGFFKTGRHGFMTNNQYYVELETDDTEQSHENASQQNQEVDEVHMAKL